MGNKSFEAYCDSLWDKGLPTQPDSDISGIGVIAAFVTSAYLTLAVVLGLYLFGLAEPDLLNGVDTSILHIRARHYKGSLGARITKCTRVAILALGDQQIVTGIAIMGAGFQGLRTGTISIYHYQIVLYLAWMSSSVHLSAITILGRYLTRNPGLLTWRLTGMSILFVMLVIGLSPTVSNAWGISNLIGTDDNSGWGIPAKCIWIEGVRDGIGVNPDAVIGYAILIVSYVWKVGQLFECLRKTYNRFVLLRIEMILFKLWRIPATMYCRHKHWIWLWIFRFVLSSTLWILVLMESLASFAASMWLSVLGIIFGTIQVFVPRTQNLYWTQVGEDSWGFGQLVPLILLIQPFGAVSEHIWPKRRALNQRSSEESESDGETATSQPESMGGLWDSISPNAQSDLGLQSLIQYLDTAYEGYAELEQDTHSHIKEIFYKSKVFHLLVWLLQAAVASTASVAFYYDYLTIGNWRSDNWQEIVIAAASYVAAGFLVTLLLLPASKLGR